MPEGGGGENSVQSCHPRRLTPQNDIKTVTNFYSVNVNHNFASGVEKIDCPLEARKLRVFGKLRICFRIISGLDWVIEFSQFLR